MSLLVDVKYVGLVSTKLERFARKGSNLYNFRCPVCGDSKKNKLKARGYFYEKLGSIRYKCHNCSTSGSLQYILNLVDTNLVKPYRLEKFKEQHHMVDAPQPVDKVVVSVPTKVVTNMTEMYNITSVKNLPIMHHAYRYLVDRKIPYRKFNDLYYTENMKRDFSSIPGYENRLSDDERIIIPFWNRNSELVGLTGRAIKETKARYMTIKILNEPLIYGLNNIDCSKPEIYVTEGQFDSMFVDNAIAVAGTDFDRAISMFDQSKTVLIFDNQPRNTEVVKIISKYAGHNYRIVVWPKIWAYKDINEAVVNGVTKSELMFIIIANTHHGLNLKLALNDWSKI